MPNTISISLTNLELTRFFFAIVLLLLFAHTFGYLLHRIKLPRVIGEIVGGALLGPTVLGAYSPSLHHGLFSAFEAEGKLLSMIYWMGLVLLMFVSGFELQKSLDKEDRKDILALTLGSTVIPFILGWIAPLLYDFSPYLGDKKNMLALQLIIAIATAITSIPVLSRIFIDLGVMDTRFAKIVLSTATIHDIVLWVALAIATGLVSTQAYSIVDITYTVGLTITFFGVSLLIMPRLVEFISHSKWNFLLRSSGAGYILFICFLFSAVASILDVNVVFGAFLAGIVVGNMPDGQFQKEKMHIKEISLAFFVPLYFAIVGLKLDLVRHCDSGFVLGFFLFTTVFAMLGTMIAAKFVKKDWLSSVNLAVAMSTRGGPGIVLATVAFELDIINETFFVTLVLIAIISSFVAGAWFKYVLHRGLPLLRNVDPEPQNVFAEANDGQRDHQTGCRLSR